MESKSGQGTRVREVETMVVFALFFLVLVVKCQRPAFLYMAIVSLLVALFVPSLARSITRVWLKLSQILAHVSNRIILTIIFYLILAPLACLYRLFNKDPLRLTPKDSGSCYSERNHTFTRADLEKMW